MFESFATFIYWNIIYFFRKWELSENFGIFLDEYFDPIFS